MGILAALMRRERDGGGCRVDVNLLSASLNLLSASLSLQQESLTCYLNAGRPKDVSQPGHVAGKEDRPPRPSRSSLAKLLRSNDRLGPSLTCWDNTLRRMTSNCANRSPATDTSFKLSRK